jgi:thiamine biosynthesis protein ThiS
LANEIEIQLNGELTRVPAGLTLAGLLAHLELTPDRVAVELNRELVRRPEWHARAVAQGAQVEVVHFVGGGHRKAAAPSGLA